MIPFTTHWKLTQHCKLTYPKRGHTDSREQVKFDSSSIHLTSEHLCFLPVIFHCLQDGPSCFY